MVGGAGVAGLVGVPAISAQDDGDLDPVNDRVEVDPADIVEGGTLRVGLVLDPDTFDQPQSVEAPATIVHELFWEGLVATDAAGEIYPWLAASYELVETQDIDRSAYEEYMTSVPIEEGTPVADEQIVVTHPDADIAEDDEAQVLTVAQTGDAVEDGVFGMQYRYQIHEGIQFHDGEELTAENVVQSYERWENSANAGQVFDQFLHAEAEDDYTVSIYAQVPDAEAELDNIWPVYPSAQTDIPLGEWDPLQGNDPIGTGPWVFEAYEEQNFITVSRNENYWLEDIGLDSMEWWDGPEAFPASPVIDTIEMEIVPEDSTRAAALESGELDLTYNLTADQKTNFDRADGFRVPTSSGGSYLFVQFPVTVEPFDDERVRRAINHLIPRTNIVETIEQGWAEEAWAPLPELAAGEGTTDYDQLVEDLRQYNEYDPQRAQELLQDADVEPPISVTFQTNSDNDDRVRKAQFIVEALNASNLFDATLETPGDLTTFVGILFDQEYHTQGNVAMVGLSGTFNPHSFVEAIHHPRQFLECCNGNLPPGSLPEDFVEAMDEAQYGIDIVDDPELRAQRYDDLWEQFLEINANSIVDFELQSATLNDQALHGYNMYPFVTGLMSYGLWNPMDQQITYIDRP